MSREEDFIKTYNSQKPNNDSKQRKSIYTQTSKNTKQEYDGATYAEVLRLRSRVNRLEDTVQKLENKLASQIVHAPVKEDNEIEILMRRQQISRPTTIRSGQIYTGPQINRQVQVGPTRQTYARAAQAYTRSIDSYKQAREASIQMQQNRITQSLIPQKQEKLSFWQKVKRFFVGEPEKPKIDTQSSYSNSSYSNNSNNYKMNQFRESQRTTAQINVKQQPKTQTRKIEQHTFDRYA